jgi:outer membrane protein OmpA-like peptidoglycan-associated protein
MSKLIVRGLPLLALFLGVGTTWAKDCEQAKSLDQQARSTTERTQKINLWTRALSECPHPLIAFRLGDAQLDAGNASAALESFDKALQNLKMGSEKTEKLRVTLLGKKAQAYLANGQISEAGAAIGKAMESPQLTDPSMGWLYGVRRAIDTHPARTQMSAEGISRTFVANRAMGSSPRINLYILFDTNADEPNEQGVRQTKELAKALQPYAESAMKILIIGHTDERGEEGYNDALSQRRAESVTRLIASWYPELEDKLKARGKGERKPRYPGKSEEDYRLNRRVEVQIN